MIGLATHRYFDRQPILLEADPLPEVTSVDESEDVETNLPSVTDGESIEGVGRRIHFAELVRAGLLKPGDQIWCKSLKRQQRNGSGSALKDAVVTASGMVEFAGQKFSNPSKLARAMVNANGGNAKALNGYDYLFIQRESGPILLDDLRRWLLEGTPAERAVAETLLEDGRGAFRNKHEALDYVRENKPFSHLK